MGIFLLLDYKPKLVNKNFLEKSRHLTESEDTKK
jgi:hypothetical protein